MIYTRSFIEKILFIERELSHSPMEHILNEYQRFITMEEDIKKNNGMYQGQHVSKRTEFIKECLEAYRLYQEALSCRSEDCIKYVPLLDAYDKWSKKIGKPWEKPTHLIDCVGTQGCICSFPNKKET